MHVRAPIMYALTSPSYNVSEMVGWLLLLASSSSSSFLQCSDTVGWVIWPVKTHPRYDLSCVWWDIKSIIDIILNYLLAWFSPCRRHKSMPVFPLNTLALPCRTWQFPQFPLNLILWCRSSSSSVFLAFALWCLSLKHDSVWQSTTIHLLVFNLSRLRASCTNVN